MSTEPTEREFALATDIVGHFAGTDDTDYDDDVSGVAGDIALYRDELQREHAAETSKLREQFELMRKCADDWKAGAQELQLALSEAKDEHAAEVERLRLEHELQLAKMMTADTQSEQSLVDSIELTGRLRAELEKARKELVEARHTIHQVADALCLVSWSDGGRYDQASDSSVVAAAQEYAAFVRLLAARDEELARARAVIDRAKDWNNERNPLWQELDAILEGQ